MSPDEKNRYLVAFDEVIDEVHSIRYRAILMSDHSAEAAESCGLIEKAFRDLESAYRIARTFEVD